MSNITLQTLYDQAPTSFQNIMVSVSGIRKNRDRYGSEYRRYRAWLKDFDTQGREVKLQYRNTELMHLLNHAILNSAFYRRIYSEIDITQIHSPEDLYNLPVVDKEMLRANMDDAYTIPARGAVECHTGGTTGKSLIVRMTPRDMMRRMAQLDHFKSRAGFENRQMPRATFSGTHIVPPSKATSPYWRYNAATKQMLYSTFHMNEKTLGGYVDSLNKLRPKSLDGFFSSMVELANFIERNGLKLNFAPIAIFPTSETVTKSGRELLERVFQAKVFDQYASSEGAPFVTECTEGVLHIEDSSGVFEYVEDSNEILVTSFTTYGTPLIRYQIGDSMEFGSVIKCKCGIESSTVKSINGRRDDFIYRADGSKVNSGNISNLFKNLPNSLIKAQLTQHVIGEVHIALEVDAAVYQNRFDDILREEFKHKFDSDTRVVIEHVERIPREKSGKHRLIRNYLQQS